MKNASSSSPLISVIITNKNALRWLRKCLTSLKQQSYKNFEVIFVDNNSTDKSLQLVESKFRWVKTVKNERDEGYAKANNIGALKAKGSYLLLMNTDSYLEKNTLQKLSSLLIKHPEYRLMQLDEKEYDKSPLPDRYLIFSMDCFGYPIGTNGRGPIFYADGAGLVISAKLFKKLNGYDEKFYMYLEDMDLSWRARMSGEDVFFLKDVFVYHATGGTSIPTHTNTTLYTTTLNRRYHAQKNNLRALIKNYSVINILWSLPVSILLASLEGSLYLLRGNILGFAALHNAIWWNITNLPDTLLERKRVQKMRKVSDRFILVKTVKTISKFQSLIHFGIPQMKNL